MTATAPELKNLSAYTLRNAANGALDHFNSVRDHLGAEAAEKILDAAHHLRDLAKLVEADFAERLAYVESYLAAENAWKAEVEALTQAVAGTLGRVGSRRNQAVKLLDKFDITPKGN